MTLTIERKKKINYRRKIIKDCEILNQSLYSCTYLFMCVSACVGDAAVGKSALCHMFHSDGTVFQKNYSMVRA